MNSPIIEIYTSDIRTIFKRKDGNKKTFSHIEIEDRRKFFYSFLRISTLWDIIPIIYDVEWQDDNGNMRSDEELNKIISSQEYEGETK